MKGSMEFYLLTLKSGVMERMFSNELSEALMYLDVTVLTRLIFIEILGFDNSKLDNESIITYSSSEKRAIDAALSGECNASFILNPTKIEQVRDIASKGLIMPRKLKVYGITSRVKSEHRHLIKHPYKDQVRYVAAVTSQKEFAKLLDCGLSFIRDFGCITGNTKEIELALAKPHTLIFIEER